MKIKEKLLVSLIVVLALFIMNTFMYKLSATPTDSIKSIIAGNDFELNLSNEEKKWIKDNPIIRLGIDRAFPPFGSITDDKKYVGFSADIMKIIEHRSGFNFDIAKDVPWNETMKMAKTGEIDMISALVNSEQRQEFLYFTPSYIKNPTIIINDGTANGYIGSLKNLNGKKVAIERGSYSASVLSIEYPEIELVPVKNTSLALNLVSNGKADAYVGNGVTASYLIRKLGYHNLSYSGQTEYFSSHSIGIIKPNKILASIINKVLSTITKNDREMVANHWFGLNTQPVINKTMVLWIGSLLVGLLVMFGSWIISLRNAKNKLKATQSIIKQQSEVDHLTRLGNRRKFYSSLSKHISRTDETMNPFTLLYLDLDMFKEVNDRLGHAVGDLLLIQASKRLIACLAEDVSISRIGGDEFMLILPKYSKIEDINTAAECIRSVLSDAFTIEGNEVYITASIGITRYPNDASNAEQLVNNGDQAMYHSKKKGRNCYSYFNKAMQKDAVYKANLIKDLRVAIDEEHFILHYQPIIDLSTNTISKAEALIRWNNPERGLVSPAEFIPLAEETGLINDIGEWTFKEAIDHTVILHDRFDKNFQISVNTSPLQYQKNGMTVSSWCDYLTSRGLSGENIIVEITEGVLMESGTSVIDNLFQLRDLNIGVAIDDFGTGYSSLSYLKKFDIDYLKIDQTFVQNLSTDQDDVALVQAIIVMAHRLGLKVIAEGIETDIQNKILVEAGCDFGQGFYYSKPVSAANFITFIEQWNRNLLTDNKLILKPTI